MSVLTMPRRALGGLTGLTPAEPPINPDDPLLTIVDSIDDSGGNSGPRVHMRLLETAGATTIANRGWDTGTGTLSNTAQVKYRLGSLVSGSNNNGRALACSGLFSAPPLLTYTDLVTTGVLTPAELIAETLPGSTSTPTTS